MIVAYMLTEYTDCDGWELSSDEDYYWVADPLMSITPFTLNKVDWLH